jgi:hypothetical protein
VWQLAVLGQPALCADTGGFHLGRLQADAAKVRQGVATSGHIAKAVGVRQHGFWFAGPLHIYKHISCCAELS